MSAHGHNIRSSRPRRLRLFKKFTKTVEKALTKKGVRPGTPIEIWFQDEARVGQKNGLVYQWAERGSRPRQARDQRYENAYIFGAICPARDVGAALILPHADGWAMQQHLDEISRHVVTGAHAVVLLDQAGWHTTDKIKEPRMSKKFALQEKVGSYATRRGLAARCPLGFLGRSMVPIANRRANGGAHGVGTHPGLHQRDGGPGAAAAE